MCCVCDFVCKLISCIASIIFVVAVILLILWLTKVIGGDGTSDNVNVAQNEISEMGRKISPKFFGVTDKAE